MSHDSATKHLPPDERTADMSTDLVEAEISELFRKKTKMERKIRKLQEWRRDNGGSMYPPTTSNSSSNSPSQASTPSTCTPVSSPRSSPGRCKLKHDKSGYQSLSLWSATDAPCVLFLQGKEFAYKWAPQCIVLTNQRHFPDQRAHSIARPHVGSGPGTVQYARRSGATTSPSFASDRTRGWGAAGASAMRPLLVRLT